MESEAQRSPAVSRARPRPSAGTISRTAGGGAATGSSATPTTRPAAASTCACTDPRTGPGAAGKWTDAATGEHGDLLDLIAAHSAALRDRRRARRGAPFPRPARSRPAAERPPAPLRLARGGAAAVRHGPADRGHAGRDLSARGAASQLGRNLRAPLPSAVLLLARRHLPDEPPETWPALLASGDRHRRARSPAFTAPGSIRRARARRRSIRRARRWDTCSATACGSASHGTCGSAGATCSPPARASRRCSRSDGAAGPAGGRRALGQPSRCSCPAARSRASLRRRRRRRCRQNRGDRAHHESPSRGHRSDPGDAAARRFQRRSLRLRGRCTSRTAPRAAGTASDCRRRPCECPSAG